MCPTRNRVYRKVPRVRIPPSPPSLQGLNFFPIVNQGEQDKKLPKCVLETCRYPRTCRWNERCMEEGMRESKEAKILREKTIRSEDSRKGRN